MERHGWRDVWFLGSNRPHPRWWQFIGPKACAVGIWTGPELDLICVCECRNREEAERCLSPFGWTITHAAFRAWLKRRSLDVKKRVA